MQNVAMLGLADPLSSLSHFGAVLGFLVAGFFLMRRGRGNAWRVAALGIYTFCLVFLFSMSAVFHLLPPGLGRDVLQRLDHAGIWMLIAGTFTPVHVILFRGPWRWLILLFVWTVAITGLVLEVIFFKDFPELLLLSLYLGLGWMGALTGYKFWRSFGGESQHLLIGGGVFYSLGAIVDFLRWPILLPGYVGPHEIFHFLVVAAAACHWKFIYNWASHPVANQMFFHVRIFPDGHYVGESISDHLIVEAKSLEALKQNLREAVRERFHRSIVPEIHLRYFHEERI